MSGNGVSAHGAGEGLVDFISFGLSVRSDLGLEFRDDDRDFLSERKETRGV